LNQELEETVIATDTQQQLPFKLNPVDVLVLGPVPIPEGQGALAQGVEITVSCPPHIPLKNHRVHSQMAF